MTMTLTWKDAAATAFGGFAVLTYAAVTRGWGWAGLSSYRTGALVLGLLGLAMCAVGGQLAVDDEGLPDPQGKFDIKNPWTAFMSILGTGALGLTIAGSITGSTTVFMMLGLDILVLWALATLHHMYGGLLARGGGAHPVH
jgi:hypothetical protein